MEDPTDTPNDDATSNGTEVAVDLSSLGLSEMGEALFRLSAIDAAMGRPPTERMADLKKLFEQIGKDMARQSQCSCAKLRDYLSSDETLDDVDHLHPEIAQISCFDWLTENWISALDGTTPRVNVPLDVGRFTDALDIDQWPIPLRDEPRIIYAVIRQFVEEAPNERSDKFGAVLQAHPQWQPMIKRLQDRLEIARATFDHPQEIFPELEDLRCKKAGWYGIGTVLQELGWAGLPRTQGTASYVLTQLDSKTRQNPSRGGLLTTFLICSRQFFSDRTGVEFMETEETIQRLSWTTPWIYSNLFAQASTTAASHAKWWSGQPDVQIPDSISRGRARKPGRDQVDVDIAEMHAELMDESKAMATSSRIRANARQRLANELRREPTKTELRDCDKKTNSLISKAKKSLRRI